jgi:hypothetical protein
MFSVFSVHDPCQRVIGDSEGHLQSVIEQEAEWREALEVKEEGFS